MRADCLWQFETVQHSQGEEYPQPARAIQLGICPDRSRNTIHNQNRKPLRAYLFDKNQNEKLASRCHRYTH